MVACFPKGSDKVDLLGLAAQIANVMKSGRYKFVPDAAKNEVKTLHTMVAGLSQGDAPKVRTNSTEAVFWKP